MERPAGGPLREIMAPISFGELIDKITILEIKADRITDPAKRENVLYELGLLTAARDRHAIVAPALDDLVRALKAVNESLWEIEEAIRGLDRFCHLFLFLWPTEDESKHVIDGSSDVLEIMGGEGVYWLAGSSANGLFQRHIRFRRSPLRARQDRPRSKGRPSSSLSMTTIGCAKPSAVCWKTLAGLSRTSPHARRSLPPIARAATPASSSTPTCPE